MPVATRSTRSRCGRRRAGRSRASSRRRSPCRGRCRRRASTSTCCRAECGRWWATPATTCQGSRRDKGERERRTRHKHAEGSGALSRGARARGAMRANCGERRPNCDTHGNEPADVSKCARLIEQSSRHDAGAVHDSISLAHAVGQSDQSHAPGYLAGEAHIMSHSHRPILVSHRPPSDVMSYCGTGGQKRRRKQRARAHALVRVDGAIVGVGAAVAARLRRARRRRLGVRTVCPVRAIVSAPRRWAAEGGRGGVDTTWSTHASRQGLRCQAQEATTPGVRARWPKAGRDTSSTSQQIGSPSQMSQFE